MSVLKVENLGKNFGTFTAVNDISFSVTKNHVIGFLGPNGAGKTTTLRMIVGLSKPTNGSIEVLDNVLEFGDTKSKMKIGYLPEQPSFYTWMTGFEYLSFVTDLFKMSDSQKKKRIPEILKLVELYDFRNKKIATYSNGMKQRLGIAQATINSPELIILDEPVSSLDPIGRKEVLKIIEKLKDTSTILFSTHILSDVDKICDDIILLNKGMLVVSSQLSELKTKYSSSILEVEFTKNSNLNIKELEYEKWVSRVDKSGNHIKIWITDNKVLEDNIPMKFFIKQNVGISKYGLMQPEVEDLFLELLEKKHE